MYNTRCPLCRLNCGIKFISIVQASTVGIFMQEMTNSFMLSHYEDATCTLQGYAYVFDILNPCKTWRYRIFRWISDRLVKRGGLWNNMKRQQIFRQLKNKKCLIFFLQEVHYSKDKEVIWSPEWGYTATFSSLSNAIVRVSILFNNVFETLTLVNICVPNYDEPSFVESVLKMLLTLSARNACGMAILKPCFRWTKR